MQVLVPRADESGGLLGVGDDLWHDESASSHRNVASSPFGGALRVPSDTARRQASSFCCRRRLRRRITDVVRL